jgi:hypothetical protein
MNFNNVLSQASVVVESRVVFFSVLNLQDFIYFGDAGGRNDVNKVSQRYFAHFDSPFFVGSKS